jgi:hypothetical protein
VVRQRRYKMRPWSPLLFGAPERFPIESHGGRWRLRRGGQTLDDTVGPGSHRGFALRAIHVPKDRMERGRTGRVVREAQRLRQPGTIIAAPGGDGTLAAIPTQHRPTRQRQDGGEWMAFPTRLTKIGDGSEHCNERTGMCSHQAPPLVRGVAQVGDAGQAEPHGEHNPLSRLGTYHATPI